MRTSEQCNEIFAALAKAQGQMTGAEKSASNPHFRSQYSDLASVIDALKQPLSDNGLCHLAGPEQIVDGAVMVTTRIGHSSGQWIEATAQVPLSGKAINAQTYGSAVSYGRRYGLQALTGLASVDDDGNAASEAPAAAQSAYKPPSELRAQLTQLAQKIAQLGDESVVAQMLSGFKVSRIEDIPADKLTGVLRRLDQLIAERK